MENLPKSFVRQGQVNYELDKLQQQVAGVNNAIKVFEAEGIPTDLDFLRANTLTQAAFNAWMKTAESSYIGQLGFLPKKERERIHSTFTELAARVENARNSIGTFISGAKYPILQSDGKSIGYDWNKVRETIEKQNTYVFTAEDKEYFQVLSEAREALIKIAQWEQEHTYAPIARVFGNVGRLLSTNFSAQWFQANIGWRIGKSNAEALRMLREQEDED